MSYLLFGIEVAFETEMILDKLRISALATKPEYVLACFHCSIPNSLPLKLSEFDDFNNEPFKKYYRIIGPTKQQNKVYPHQRWFKKAVVAPQETPQWDLTTVSNSKNLPNLSNHQATP